MEQRQLWLRRSCLDVCQFPFPSGFGVGYPPHRHFSSLSGNGGVYKTTDSGATWNFRSNGLISGGINSLVIDPATPNILYVAFEGWCTPVSRIYKTTNGADNWAQVGSSPPLAPMALTIDPLNPATLYVAD